MDRRAATPRAALIALEHAQFGIVVPLPLFGTVLWFEVLFECGACGGGLAHAPARPVNRRVRSTRLSSTMSGTTATRRPISEARHVCGMPAPAVKNKHPYQGRPRPRDDRSAGHKSNTRRSAKRVRPADPRSKTGGDDPPPRAATTSSRARIVSAKSRRASSRSPALSPVRHRRP